MKYLSSARERGFVGTGTILKTLAKTEAQKASFIGFKASDGLIGKVKARHGISGKNLSGEVGTVNVLTVQELERKELPGILANYEMENVYNYNETGLSWKQPTKKSLVLHGDDGQTGKKDKSRISLLMCTSWTGEKEKLLFFSHCENPRRIKGIDKSKLPVQCHTQKEMLNDRKHFS